MARIGTPGPMPPSERYSTGKPVGWKGRPSSVARFFAGPSSEPGTAMPDTSPFTSAANTETPAVESCSAITWSVLVLPVPVAPATRPWRFIVASGSRTVASGTSAPPRSPVPSSMALPFVAYAAAISAPKAFGSGAVPATGRDRSAGARLRA